MPYAPIRRFLLLLSALLALVPASGAALCVEESGHLAIELVGTDCSPMASGNDTCMDACSDCEDTPLSVGAAQRVSTHVELDAVFLEAALPAGIASLEHVRAPRRDAGLTTSLFANRSPLLRC
jgi:hypothetical protein